MTSILEVSKLNMQFGGIKAVCDLNFALPEKSISALIGPNGAGKTTVFNMLTGVYKPTSGDVLLCGKSVVGKATHEIVRCGVARTFQNIRLFKDLTVFDNVRIGYDIHANYGLLHALLRTGKCLAHEKLAVENANRLLEIFKLDNRKDELAKNLPYGAQRRLEIARAMATGAKLLLLDEPAAGMNNQETLELMKTISWIRNEFDLTILLIEHDMKLVMGVSQKIFVLDYGVKIAEGDPAAIKNDPRVIEAYLGRSATQ